MEEKQKYIVVDQYKDEGWKPQPSPASASRLYSRAVSLSVRPSVRQSPLGLNDLSCTEVQSVGSQVSSLQARR